MSAGRRIITIFASHYLPHLGGVERIVGWQAKEFARHGFAVRIVTHDTEGLGFAEIQPAITIYRLKCWSPMAHNRMPFPVSLLQLYRLIREIFANPSELTIVHTRYYFLSVLGCLLARCSGGKLALMDHSSDYIQLGSSWLNALSHIYEHLMTLMIQVFCPRFFGDARACGVWLRRFGIRRAGVCYNAIDLQQRLNSPTPLRDILGPVVTKKVVFTVGRLVEEKGFMELVEGFTSFAEHRDDYVLVIAGHGELEPRLQAAAQTNPKIRFLGRQPLETVMSLMMQAFVLVNPSNYPEGLQTILLEAGLCGLAVISTPAGGAAEIIIDGKTGILIDRGESPRIAEALLRLDVTPGLRDRLARNLRHRIESDFSCSIIAERFLFHDMELAR